MTPPGVPWRVVVADDEPLARDVLRELLVAVPEFTLIGECRTGVEVIDRVTDGRPDLLLLDIQMPDLDGLEAVRRLPPETMPVVILVTAYESFALPAFELEVLDYLVKPFTDQRFFAALDRAARRLRDREGSRRWRTAFRVATGHRVLSLPAGEVTWIEARDYAVRLHARGQRFLIRGSLARIGRELDPAQWVRVHRGALVNLAHVDGIDRRVGSGLMILRDGSRVPVSERRRADVFARMDGPRTD